MTASRRPIGRRSLAAIAVGLALSVAACGDDDADDAAATDPATETAGPDEGTADTAPTDTGPTDTGPTGDDEAGDTGTEDGAGDADTQDGAGGTTGESEDGATATTASSAMDADPLRIVSLSPTHTEMLFAIDAGDELVAVDDQSNHPPEALELPNDLSGFEPNVEAIASYEPDLVVIGGDFTGLGDQLAALEIDSWDGPAAATLDDTYAQIEELGELTGHAEEATELVEQMQTDIESILAQAPTIDPAPGYYHELDPGLFSVTSDSFIGQLYSLLGLRSVADELETDAGPFPQLTAEFLVSADPQLIFLADTKCCGETAATVAARDGWDVITAVQAGNVFEMDDDIASRWGPRVVDYLERVATILDGVATG